MTEEAVTQEQPEAAPVESLITEKAPALDFSKGKPEGFPDEFWDAEKKMPVADKLFNAYQNEKKRVEGLRYKLSKGEFDGKAPEDIKEYTLTLDEKLKPLVPDDDPLLQVAREAAKAKGMPKEMFNDTFAPVIAKLAELSEAANRPPTEEEINAYRAAELEKLGPSGQKIVDAVDSFITQATKTGVFSEADAKIARAMTNSADNVRVLNKLRMMSGAREIPIEVPIDAMASKEDIGRKMAEAMTKGNEAEYNMLAAKLRKLNN